MEHNNSSVANALEKGTPAEEGAPAKGWDPMEETPGEEGAPAEAWDPVERTPAEEGAPAEGWDPVEGTPVDEELPAEGILVEGTSVEEENLGTPAEEGYYKVPFQPCIYKNEAHITIIQTHMPIYQYCS